MKPILLFLLTCAMWGQTCNSWDRENFDGVPTEMAVKAKDIALCKQWLDSTCQDDQAVILVCPAGFKVMYDWQLHHAATTDGQVIWQTVGYPWPECMDEAKAKERLRDFYVSADPKPAVSNDKPIVLGTPIPPSEEAWHVTNPQNVVPPSNICTGACMTMMAPPTATDDPNFKHYDSPAPKPAVSSDKKPTCVEQGDCNNYVTGLITKGFDDEPAPKPSFTVEKAVKTVEHLCGNIDESADYEPDTSTVCRINSNRTFLALKRTKYSCKLRPGYRSFLLPDESTGEKVCLNILKEKP